MEVHQLEDGREFDMLNVLGDLIQRAFLPREFFGTVASRISNQIILFNKLARHLHVGTRRRHQVLEEAGAPISLRRSRFLTKKTAKIRGRVRGFQVQMKIHCGYKRLAMSIAPNTQHPPSIAVYSFLHLQKKGKRGGNGTATSLKVYSLAFIFFHSRILRMLSFLYNV
jgi:hypothetical protein